MKDEELVNAFKAARERIAAGVDDYICYALGDVEDWGEVPRITCGRAQDLIMDRLDLCLSYESWVHENHCMTYPAMSHKEFREGRLQWLDSLIKEFS